MTLFNLFLYLLAFILLIIPVGKHLAKIIMYEKTIGEKIFSVIEAPIFKPIKCTCENMSLKNYILSFLVVNLVMYCLTYGILTMQGNSPSLAFNTAISFITNTNLQHYSGEWLNGIASRLALINLMFTSAASGMAICMAIIRGVMGIRLGNFYEDIVKSVTRLLLPASIIVGVGLVLCGLPQTFDTQIIVKTVEDKYQVIPLGPAAAWEAIKHLGTNGGGLFSSNSTHPFENISLWSNYIEMMSMMIFPGATTVAFGC